MEQVADGSLLKFAIRCDHQHINPDKKQWQTLTDFSFAHHYLHGQTIEFIFFEEHRR